MGFIFYYDRKMRVSSWEMPEMVAIALEEAKRAKAEALIPVKVDNKGEEDNEQEIKKQKLDPVVEQAIKQQQKEMEEFRKHVPKPIELTFEEKVLQFQVCFAQLSLTFFRIY
jgi:hypothetical protein